MRFLLVFPEESLTILKSEEDSRPNAPVNILVGADIFRTASGWNDAELDDNLSFDLLVRHALGLNNLNQDRPAKRTMCNFRRRFREYAEETGVNLYQETFQTITGEQLLGLEMKPGWQPAAE